MANTLGNNSRHALSRKDRSPRTALLPALAMLCFGMLPGAQAAIFPVTKVADTNDGFCNADCSLREAIRAANASAGVADTITFNDLAGSPDLYTLTIAGNAEDAAATGDLDITDTVTITGNGSGETIIQAGTTNASGIDPGIDKVFSVNQLGTTSASATFNGVTIRFGRNTSACDFAVTFAHLGAGIDFFGGLSPTTTSLTITNSVITQNTVANSCAAAAAAGVSVDNGNLTITGSTITNNETTNQPGGGVSFTGDSRTMVMTSSTVSNNKANGGLDGEGGGIFIRQNVNGTVMIHSSTISNNTSESRAGGIKLDSNGTLNTTIDQLTLISGNTSVGTGDGISRGGGVDISINGGTTTLKDVTITNNHADGESGNPSDPGTGGGIFNNLGTLNVSLSRITANTAPTGSGLFGAGGAVTAENNWWGCDDFPGVAAAGCDTVAGAADDTPRLDLVVTATPSTIVGGGTSSVKADFSTNSAGTAVNPVVLNGLTIFFSENNGDMDPTSAPLANLMATSEYTNTSCPSNPTVDTVMAGLDNGTDDASITINCPPPTTTTTTLPPTTTTTTLPPTTTTTTLPPTTTTTLPPTTTTTTLPPTTTTTTLPPTTTTTSTTTTTLPPTTTTTLPPPTTTTLPPPKVACHGLKATIVGTNASQTLIGTTKADVIHGLGGNDLIFGLGGNDVICGGNGRDRLFGNGGRDKLFGQANNDAMNGGRGSDSCNGGAGTDTAVNCQQTSNVP